MFTSHAQPELHDRRLCATACPPTAYNAVACPWTYTEMHVDRPCATPIACPRNYVQLHVHQPCATTVASMLDVRNCKSIGCANCMATSHVQLQLHTHRLCATACHRLRMSAHMYVHRSCATTYTYFNNIIREMLTGDHQIWASFQRTSLLPFDLLARILAQIFCHVTFSARSL